MLQRLSIALAQIKPRNASKKLTKLKSDKLYIICIEQKKLLKKYITI